MMVYKYLIVGSNCKMRWEMDKLSPYVQRIPGPIDNCVLLDPMGIDYILSGEYLEDIKNKNYRIAEVINEKPRFIFKNKIMNIHNDLTSEDFLNHSIERIENFKNNIFNEDIFLVMSLYTGISAKIERFQELFSRYPSLERINFFMLDKIKNFDFFNSYNLLKGNKIENFLKMKKK